ncbi:hypothetical protein AX14_013107 [Amanita brunnescens Koide BX004]|nr:hypothetical protein AX14_013107 [Amanita brunnescens Koide BX004]
MYDNRVHDQECWEEMVLDLRVFHEALGFAADSTDIPRFLDLPTASVEWDGDANGPLTPWELIHMIGKEDDDFLEFTFGSDSDAYASESGVFE